MCRHAAYIGPGATPADLITETDHGLLHQSYQPRELISGSVCADGYGFGWFADDVARYAFPEPVWSDGNLTSLAPRVRGRVVMAAVRNATIAGSNMQANCAPFEGDGLLFSHNGLLESFEDHWQPRLAEVSARPKGNTDSEMIFLALRSRLGAQSLAETVQETCRALLDMADGKEVQLNLLVSDGEQLIATRCGTGRQNSLYTLQDGEEFPGAWVVASEPLYDDPLWQPVAENSLVVLQADAPCVTLRI